MKNIFLPVLLILAIAVNANPNFVINTNIQYSSDGKIIHPDKFFLRHALKAYQDGYNQSAYSYFLKAAAFGNTIAGKYIGLMNIKALGVSRDWATGYAWIKLASLDNTPEHINLERKIFKLLSPEELSQSEIIFIDIKEDYDNLAALKRRDRWLRKQKNKIVGSRVGAQTSNVYSYGADGRLLHANISGAFDEMKSFVDDFNYGFVTSGEIIPVEETEDDQ